MYVIPLYICSVERSAPNFAPSSVPSYIPSSEYILKYVTQHATHSIRVHPYLMCPHIKYY